MMGTVRLEQRSLQQNCLGRNHHGLPCRGRSFRHLLATLVIIGLTACAGIAPEKDHRSLTPVALSDLPGWSKDKVSDALPALLRSCAPLSRTQKVWREACAVLTQIPAHDDAALRTVLARHFRAYALAGRGGRDGLFTGYFEATLHGSLTPSTRYTVPLYAKPKDWAEADLGLFRGEWSGQKLIGKVVDHKFVPYDDRASIINNLLGDRAAVLAWVDDPVQAFILAIQGSGRVILDDNPAHTLRLGYDGTNGKAYNAIGKAMLERGLIDAPVTMPKIRAWLAAHPGDADTIMNLNPSYVFYRTLSEGSHPVGAQGVELTPERSLAVDPAFIPLGAAIWLDTTDGDGNPLQRLMVAQDTGGAIKGVVRGDVFWGAGDQADHQAGLMRNTGRATLIVPAALKLDD